MFVCRGCLHRRCRAMRTRVHARHTRKTCARVQSPPQSGDPEDDHLQETHSRNTARSLTNQSLALAAASSTNHPRSVSVSAWIVAVANTCSETPHRRYDCMYTHCPMHTVSTHTNFVANTGRATTIDCVYTHSPKHEVSMHSLSLHVSLSPSLVPSLPPLLPFFCSLPRAYLSVI